MIMSLNGFIKSKRRGIKPQHVVNTCCGFNNLCQMMSLTFPFSDISQTHRRYVVKLTMPHCYLQHVKCTSCEVQSLRYCLHVDVARGRVHKYKRTHIHVRIEKRETRKDTKNDTKNLNTRRNLNDKREKRNKNEKQEVGNTTKNVTIN